jgi:hypothetical protein
MPMAEMMVSGNLAGLAVARMMLGRSFARDLKAALTVVATVVSKADNWVAVMDGWLVELLVVQTGHWRVVRLAELLVEMWAALREQPMAD